MTHSAFVNRLYRELNSQGGDVSYRQLLNALEDAETGAGGCGGDRGCHPGGDRFEARRTRRGDHRGNLDDMGQDFDRATRDGDLRTQDRITDELGDDVRWSSRADERAFDELDLTGRELRDGDVDFSRGALRGWGRDRNLSAGGAEEQSHRLIEELRQALAAEQSGRDGVEGPLSGRSMREIRGDLESLADAMDRDGYSEQAGGIWDALDRVSDDADGAYNERRV